MFFLKRMAMVAVLMIGGALLAPSAKATTVTGSYSVGLGTGFASPYDYAAFLAEDTVGGLKITVTPAIGVGFITSGAGHGNSIIVGFGSLPVTLSGVTTGFVVGDNGGTFHADGSGDWGGFGVACSAALCGSGGSSPYFNAVEFTVDGKTTADLLANGPNGYYGAVDVCLGGTGCSGGTGLAALQNLTQRDTPPPNEVPEPAGVAFTGAGLAALGLIRRQRKRSDHSDAA